jgi:mRNA deadenylase 3'-5' endonuclease subunit Ccr4
VDYIWYTPDSCCAKHRLHPVSVLQPPPALSLPRGLPDDVFGSDHVSLVSDFVLQAAAEGGS